MTQVELAHKLTFLENEVTRHEESIETLEKLILHVGDEVRVTIHIGRDDVVDDPIHFVKSFGLIYLLKKEVEELKNEIKKTLNDYSSNVTR